MVHAGPVRMALYWIWISSPRQRGAGVITLGEAEIDNWATEVTLWLVENQALFDRLDWLPDQQTATIVWYRGQLQNSIIDWLAKRPRAASVIIFPIMTGWDCRIIYGLNRRCNNSCAYG